MSWSWIKRPGIRLRLTALYVAIFGFTLILFSVLLYQGFIRTHEREFDIALYNYAIDVAQSVELDFFGGVTLRPNALSQSEKIFPFALGKSYLEITTLDGQILAKSRNLGERILPIKSGSLRDLPQKGSIIQTVALANIAGPNSGAFRIISYYLNQPGGLNYALHIAVPMRLLESEKQGLIFLFGFSIPFLIIASTFAGLYLSRRALRPVDLIITKARSISAQQLSERVPVPQANDEIRMLAETLNELLDRLQGAFESQEKFIADASHELKTPLAILRGEIDMMMRKDRSAQEVLEFLSSASQEVSYLSRIVEDLLILARMDTGVSGVLGTPLRLDELVIETVARAEKISLSKDLKFKIKIPDTIDEANPPTGDADLVRCLIFNLLENAVKFSPERSTIDCVVENRESDVQLSVRDQGPGIPLGEQELIFNRFYRSKETQKQTQGSGLGLALVRRIAQVHGAHVQIKSDGASGTWIAVDFPKPGLKI